MSGGSGLGDRARAAWARAMAFSAGDWPRRVAGRVLGDRRSTMLFWILDRYGKAGAGIIATGLALRALRSLLLFVLFVVAVSGWIVSDPSVQQAIYDALVLAAPPLADLVGSGLDSLAASRVPLGILGVAGLLWGVSGFYETLDDSMSRIITGPRRRDLVERHGRGVLTALLAVLALLAIAGLVTVLAGVEALIDPLPGGALAWHLLTLVGGTGFVALVALVVYRLVPTDPPTVGQALLPALLVGVILAILTSLYTMLVPLLVRAFTVFGAVAGLIGALMWLEFVFQALLFGGTWAAGRRDEARGAAGPSGAGFTGRPTGS